MNNIVVCLSTYNGEKFLKEQIDSLLKQTVKVDIIILDDGSTDNTIDIIKKYETTYSNISYLKDNITSSSAKKNFSILTEYSISLNKYNYFMFCDQDDIWLPEKIEQTLKKMREIEKSNSDIPLLIHTDLKVVSTNLDILSDSYWSYQGIDPKYDTLNRLLVHNVITGCTVMINKKLANIALPIPNEVIMHDWWLGLVASSFGQIHHINTPTMLYRQHSNNDTGATSFNIKTILHKAKDLSSVDLGKYINQTKSLLYRYSEHLTKDQKLLLEDFISIEQNSWLRSKRILIKHKILKQDLIRNIGLLLCR